MGSSPRGSWGGRFRLGAWGDVDLHVPPESLSSQPQCLLKPAGRGGPQVTPTVWAAEAGKSHVSWSTGWGPAGGFGDFPSPSLSQPALRSAGGGRIPFCSKDTAINLQRTRGSLPHAGIPACSFGRADCLPGLSPPPASPPPWILDPGSRGSILGGFPSCGPCAGPLLLPKKGN